MWSPDGLGQGGGQLTSYALEPVRLASCWGPPHASSSCRHCADVLESIHTGEEGREKQPWREGHVDMQPDHLFYPSLLPPSRHAHLQLLGKGQGGVERGQDLAGTVSPEDGAMLLPTSRDGDHAREWEARRVHAGEHQVQCLGGGACRCPDTGCHGDVP